jgi:hypothetical protein
MRENPAQVFPLAEKAGKPVIPKGKPPPVLPYRFLKIPVSD